MGGEQKKKEGELNPESVSHQITISSSAVVKAYEALSSTFDVQQKNIASSYELKENILILKQIAENSVKSVQLAEQQRDDAVNESKTEKKRFYISTTIAILAVIISVIAILLVLFHV